MRHDDQERIMIILSSHAIYYHADRGSNKRTRTINIRQVCDESLSSLIVSKKDYKSSINQFFDDHKDQGQNDKLNHYKSTFTTFHDPRRNTQLEGFMTVANVLMITQTQENIEEQL